MSDQRFAALFSVFVGKFTDEEGLDFETAQFDFGFHLTDGLREIKKLVARLETSTPETAVADADALFSFFNDGLNHLIAARSIVLQDVFPKG
jgi:hypothetical protein